MEIVDEVFTGLGELLHGHFSIDIKAELGGKGVEIKDSDEGEVSIDLFNESKPTSPQSHAFGLHSRSYGKKDSSGVDDLSRVVFQRVYPKPMGGKGSASAVGEISVTFGGNEKPEVTFGGRANIEGQNGAGITASVTHNPSTDRTNITVSGKAAVDFDDKQQRI